MPKEVKESLWIEARSLTITWVDDTRYWRWTSDESGQEVAELIKVSWFEIRVTVDTNCLCKTTRYAAYFVFKLKSSGSLCNVDTALATLRYARDKAHYGIRNRENWRCQVFIAKTKSPGDRGRFPHHRRDGWMEVKLGHFYVSSGNEGEVHLQLSHLSNQSWKSGLVVKGIEVRPN